MESAVSLELTEFSQRKNHMFQNEKKNQGTLVEIVSAMRALPQKNELCVPCMTLKKTHD